MHQHNLENWCLKNRFIFYKIAANFWCVQYGQLFKTSCQNRHRKRNLLGCRYVTFWKVGKIKCESFWDFHQLLNILKRKQHMTWWKDPNMHTMVRQYTHCHHLLQKSVSIIIYHIISLSMCQHFVLWLVSWFFPKNFCCKSFAFNPKCQPKHFCMPYTVVYCFVWFDVCFFGHHCVWLQLIG